MDPSSDQCGKLREFIQRHWRPEKIDKPTVDPALKDLDGAQRSGEVVRYSILSWEFWLSPNGQLREWFRLNGKLATWLLIPAVLVVPVTSFILWQICLWMGWLVGIAGKLIVFPLAVLIAAGVMLAAVTIIRAVLGK